MSAVSGSRSAHRRHQRRHRVTAHPRRSWLSVIPTLQRDAKRHHHRASWRPLPNLASFTGAAAGVAGIAARRITHIRRHHSQPASSVEVAEIAEVAEVSEVAPIAIDTAAVSTTATEAAVQLPARVADSDRELRGRVWALALPAIGEQLLALGVGASDTFLSGHLSSYATAHLGYGQADAVSAVGVASTAVWVVLTSFFAINIGVTALVARAIGAKDRKLAARAAGQGILLGLTAGLILLLAAVPMATLITHVLGVSGRVAALAAAYIRVFSLALPATGAASAMTAAMRGAGDARRPLLVMLVVNGLNIAGSWVLMNGLPSIGIQPIGVIGSACGAGAGWLCGSVLAFMLLRRHHPRAPQLVRAALRPNLGLARRILRVGLPSAAELTVFQLGILSFLRLVVPLGANVYAANTAINTVESIGTLPGFGFSVAATTLVGQALGSADPALAVRIVWAAMRPCVLVMGVIGALALVVPHLLLGLFVSDPVVLAAGDIPMRFSALTLPACAASFVFIGALRGAGDTKFPVVVRASGTWLVRVPVALLLIPLLGLPGGRLAMSLDYCTQAAITYWRFRSGRWRRAKV